MIFVYSSTGNSIQLAQAIAIETGDETVNILDVPEGDVDVTSYDIVGFVTPVYFFNMPRILRKFIDRLVFREGQRFYMVFTYGTTPDRACRRAIRYFSRRGMVLSHAFAFKMPENYVALFSPPRADRIGELLDSVPAYARTVTDTLSSEPCVVSKHLGLLGLLTLFGDVAYDLMRGTKGFHVDGRCTGCGLCTKVCPDGTISLSEGVPVWDNGKCQHCMGCINRCPVGAIQYKGRTQRRSRYVNPRVRLR